jgi:hypothetical protein
MYGMKAITTKVISFRISNTAWDSYTIITYQYIMACGKMVRRHLISTGLEEFMTDL